MLPSRFEGFPLVVLEAMALGLPVVAYDVGGVSEAVVDGTTGFTVRAGDRTALVDRIEELLRAPDRAERMGDRGRSRVLESFGVEPMVEAYESIYQEILAKYVEPRC